MLTYSPKLSPKLINLIKLFSCLVCLSATSVVSANDYKVEVILFERIQSGAASESHHYEAPLEMKHEQSPWHLEPTLLLKEANELDKSQQYLVQRHYAWGVESLPYEKSANYTIIERQSQGYIKVYADHLLFANIDLDHKGFRMREKRRLKLDEKHYFDHPKFGVLMQVSRLERAEDDTDLDEKDLESSR